MEYNKLPIDFPEQLRKLKERGMIITNENDALELLGSITQDFGTDDFLLFQNFRKNSLYNGLQTIISVQ